MVNLNSQDIILRLKRPSFSKIQQTFSNGATKYLINLKINTKHYSSKIFIWSICFQRDWKVSKNLRNRCDSLIHIQITIYINYRGQSSASFLLLFFEHKSIILCMFDPSGILLCTLEFDRHQLNTNSKRRFTFTKKLSALWNFIQIPNNVATFFYKYKYERLELEQNQYFKF